jgi:hypothetical protein
MLVGMQCHLGLKGFGIYSSLPNLICVCVCVCVCVLYLEIISKPHTFSKPVITSTTSALDGTQNQIFQESVIGVLPPFQYQRSIQAQVPPNYIVNVLLRKK